MQELLQTLKRHQASLVLVWVLLICLLALRLETRLFDSMRQAARARVAKLQLEAKSVQAKREELFRLLIGRKKIAAEYALLNGGTVGELISDRLMLPLRSAGIAVSRSKQPVRAIPGMGLGGVGFEARGEAPFEILLPALSEFENSLPSARLVALDLAPTPGRAAVRLEAQFYLFKSIAKEDAK